MTAEAPHHRSWSPRPLWLACAAFPAALVALAAALRWGAPPVAEVPTLSQAGPLTEGGLPVAEFLTNAAGTITVGWLLLAVVFLPAGEGGTLSAPARRCLRAASLGAAAWALAALGTAVLTISDLAGVPVTDVLKGSLLVGFLTDLTLGRALLAVAVIAVAVSAGARLPRTVDGAGYLLVAALAGLVPPVFTGHAASSGSHSLAVYGMAVHVIGAAVWVGGLVALTLMYRDVTDHLADVVSRYSGLALVCWAAVAASGLISAWTRLGGFDLTSRYGALVAVKTLALAALAALGWWHRRSSIPALRTSRRAMVFARVAAVEIVVMAVTMAVAVGLSRTAAPVQEAPPASTPEMMLGFPLPGPPDLRAYALGWWFDPPFLAVVLAGGALYLAGVLRLRRRGTAWPLPRTLAWFAGLAVVLVATCGGPARYSMVLFSVHVVQHLALSMLAPAMLLLGAPRTLALRALRAEPARAGRTPRQILLAVLHSRALWVLSHPLLASTLFVTSLYGFYRTPLFEASLRDHALHSLAMACFVLAGLLYLWTTVGSGPHRLRPGARFLPVLAVLPCHAFFGIGLMTSEGVLAAGWYNALGRAWGAAPLDDQRAAGGLALVIAGTTTALIVIALTHRWVREARRPGREPAAPGTDPAGRGRVTAGGAP
ncbi:copper resistance protein CopD [Actinomadura craniellae]|uniref:Copper resistance protein CopD n=1 Tax=Actinomadura craniellae TaxID=2231787 RepID=A0A365GZN4_9ACTN|nr:bifunctional copper resistance protein CopD/cytochrome c oxidase assembly protein [Actinomadura craniellae]RAY12281.1 copper resistance protein CopD [Actinomadura craniellae]